MNFLLKLVKRKRTVQITLGLFFLYNLVGFFVVPWLIRSVIPSQVSDRMLNGRVAIERASANPYTFAVSAGEITVSDLDGEVVASLDEVQVNFDPIRSLLSWRFCFDEIQVSGPYAAVVLLSDGSLSLLELLKASDTPKEQTSLSLPPVSIDSINLDGGEVSLTDDFLGAGFREEIEQIQFRAVAFSTAPEAANEMTFSAQTARGAQARWQGVVHFDPLSSTGTLKLDDFRSDVYEPYYKQMFSADLSTEGLSVSIDYVFAPAAEEPKIGISNTRLEQVDVALSEPNQGRTLMGANRIIMDGIAVDFISGQASMSQFVVDGESFFAARDKNKEINLMKYLLPKGFEPNDFVADVEEEVKVSAETLVDRGEDLAETKDILYAIQRAVVHLQRMIELAWQFEMDHLELKNKRIELADEGLDVPALLVVESFDLLITELSNHEGKDAQVDLSLNIRGGGRIEVSGTVTPFPTTMRLEYKIEGIDLSLVSPYVQALNQTQLKSGIFYANGDLIVDFERLITSRELPDLELNGSMGIRDFLLTETSGEDSQNILSWDSLEVRQYTASTQPNHRLQLEAIELNAPYGYLEVLSNGTLSLQNLIPASEDVVASGGTELASVDSSESELPLHLIEIRLPLTVDVAAIQVSDGSFEVRDHFYGTGFHARWDSLSARIQPLTTKEETPIQIEASGQQMNGSSFDANVVLTDPLIPQRTVEAKFETEVLATPFTPYAARVVGYEVSEGRVAVDASVRLLQGEVDARVKIDMDQFSFGDRAEVDEVMVKLPVKLAISLMKDREGKIDLPEIKVDGSLNDPEFNVGEVVGGVLVRMITNAATKPFSFIAGAFGEGGEDDLEQIIFEPGSSDIPADQFSKLKVLSDALFNRPQLSLVIEGYAAPVAELDAAKRIKLDQALNKITGLARDEQLKVLYHDRLPEAFATFQIEGLNSGPIESPKELSDESAEKVSDESAEKVSDEKRPGGGGRNVFGLVTNLIGNVIPVGSDEGAANSVEGQTGGSSASVQAAVDSGPSPFAEHPALTDEKFIFPSATMIETALLETITIPDSYWTELATARSAGVMDALLSVREFSAGRVTAATPEPSEEAPAMSGIRFQLQ